MKFIKLALLFMLLFFAGFVSGHWVSEHNAQKRIAVMAPGALRVHLESLQLNVESVLALSQEQSQRFQSILDKSLEKMAVLRTRTKEEGLLILREIDIEMGKILTQDQSLKYQTIRQTLYLSSSPSSPTG
jgi:hypothetical protein